MLTEEEIKSQLKGQHFDINYPGKLLSEKERRLCSYMFCPDIVRGCQECIGIIRESDVRNLNPKLARDKMVEAIQIVQLIN